MQQFLEANGIEAKLKQDRHKQWIDLCRIEPRLLSLENEVRSCAHLGVDMWRAYERMKSKLHRLAGWYALKTELRTCDAYEIGCDFLLSILEGGQP